MGVGGAATIYSRRPPTSFDGTLGRILIYIAKYIGEHGPGPPFIRHWIEWSYI